MSNEYTISNKRPKLELLNGLQSEATRKRLRWKKPVILSLLGFVSFIGLRSLNKIVHKNPRNSNLNNVQELKTSGDESLVGQYRCSPYHHDKALELKPKISKKSLESDNHNLKLKHQALLRLDSKINALKKMGNVTEFNKAIVHYNSELSIIKNESKELETLKQQFNDQADKHNNYLSENCIRAGKGKEFADNEE